MPDPSNHVSTPQLLTRFEAAEVLNVSPRTVWNLTARGELSHVRIGRSVRFSVEDLRQFIASRRKEALK